jgi:hypothetical protein
MVCGLPDHVQARFDPNPATSKPDTTFSPIASAHTTLTVLSFWNALPGTYGLEVFAYPHDTRGNPVNTSSFVDPQAVTLTIDDQGQATLAPAAAVIPTDGQGCSTPPTGFGPVVAPTPSPSEIKVSAGVSDPRPALNENFTVTGSMTGRGQPVANVPVQFNFYGPWAMPSCTAFTDWHGTATCYRTNTNILPGYNVLVQVTFKYGGQTYTAYTSYTM